MNLNELLNKFRSLQTSSFIGIENYRNSANELANHNVLVNFSVKKAKEKDLETLKSLTNEDLEDIANSKGFELDIVKKALTEMIASAEKNVSENKEDRTNQSQAQSEYNYRLTNGVIFNANTQKVYIWGQGLSKKVLEKGEYKEKNSRPKTLAKKAIEKHCDLRMAKYKKYTIDVSNMGNVNMTGDTIQL